METPFAGNRVCALLGTRLPLVQGGMVWNAGWRLAAAVAAEGGLGLIGAGSMAPELLAEHIARAHAAVGARGVVGVNVPLMYAHAPAQLEVAQRAGVRVIFTSAGNPAEWVPRLKAAGHTVVHLVASARQAQKAVAAGADAVVAEGTEAGGHNGAAELTTLVLVPLVRRAVSVPLIAAGGIGTGAQWLATMALGAEGVQLGSRFAATVEGSGHARFKQAIVAAGEDSTRLVMKQLAPVRLLRNAFYDQVAAAEAQGADAQALRALLGKGRARQGMLEGDLDQGELEIGQVAALIDDAPPVATVVARLLAELAQARAQLLSATPSP